MNNKENKIDSLRQEIDAIDAHMHDLLQKRVSLVAEIAAYKREHNLKVSVPSREAVLLRRLCERHTGALDQTTLVQMWREMIGSLTLMQQPLKTAVALIDNNDRQIVVENARDYFGIVFPFIEANNAHSAVGLLREGKADFAVVPFPDEQEKQSNPWWLALQNRLNDPFKILVKLPFINVKDTDKDKADNPCLVLGRFDYESSGDDNSFIFIEADPQISRGRITELARTHDMPPLSLNTQQIRDAEKTHHLLEVRGFVEEDDKRLKTFKKDLKDRKAVIFVAGGYPVPMG